MAPALLATQDSKFKTAPAVLALLTSSILTLLVAARPALDAKIATLQLEPVLNARLAPGLTVPSALLAERGNLPILLLSCAKLATLAA